MYILIVGCGTIGYTLGKSLLAAGHEITLIEKDPVRSELMWDEFGSIVTLGDGTNSQILQSSGASRAEAFVAVTSSDETNLIACQIAKTKFGITHTVSIVKDTKNEPLFHMLGINVVINSTHNIVSSLEEAIPGKPLLHLTQSKIAGLELISVSVPHDSAIIGRTLTTLELPPHSFIAIVMKNNRAAQPINDLVLEAEDEIIAVTTSDEERILYEIFTGAI
jgi:trk system potassium uptake protein TrkA